MGWGSGIEVMRGIISATKKYVPEQDRKDFYKDVINLLEGLDWDTQPDLIGEDETFDQALFELHPDWEIEE